MVTFLADYSQFTVSFLCYVNLILILLRFILNKLIKGRGKMGLFSNIKQVFTIEEAHAHCDIPCGIYDPITAKIGAQTVLKMSVRIEALTSCEDVNTYSRYVSVKEEHAQSVKNELNILWSDYFKPSKCGSNAMQCASDRREIHRLSRFIARLY